jgi:hypothetical protein
VLFHVSSTFKTTIIIKYRYSLIAHQPSSELQSEKKSRKIYYIINPKDYQYAAIYFPPLQSSNGKY